MAGETRLWLLRARTDLPRDDDPWLDTYDRCYGMVVEADTGKRARLIANTIPLYEYGDDRGDKKSIAPSDFLRAIEDGLTYDKHEDVDNHRHELTDAKWEDKNVWLDPKYTTCEPLVCTDNEQRVIWDVVRG